MATRNGLATFLNWSHKFCIFFGRWRGSIEAAIDASSATTEQKDLMKASIAAIDAACTAVDAIRYVWES